MKEYYREYLPDFLIEIPEIYAILQSANNFIIKIKKDLIVLNDDQCILTSNNAGIKRFEKILNILDSKENIDLKRQNILKKWNEDKIYNLRALEKKLDKIFKNGLYDIVINNNEYHIDFLLPECGNAELIEATRIISNMLPCNLTYKVLKTNKSYIDVYEYSGGMMTVTKIKEVN